MTIPSNLMSFSTTSLTFWKITLESFYFLNLIINQCVSQERSRSHTECLGELTQSSGDHSTSHNRESVESSWGSISSRLSFSRHLHRKQITSLEHLQVTSGYYKNSLNKGVTMVVEPTFPCLFYVYFPTTFGTCKMTVLPSTILMDRCSCTREVLFLSD